MAEIEIINEAPISIIEVQSILEAIEKRDKQLSERGKKTTEYLEGIMKKKMPDIANIKKKLESIEGTRLKPRHIAKIIDIHPNDNDSLKTVLLADNISLKQEDINKILQCLK